MSAQATHRVIALAAIAALAACDDGQAPRSSDAPEVEVTAGANPATAPTIAQDIEAPEVFQVADEGLWDGRPSLGGLWVAHSDVTDPERVIIRNEDNGRSITAALFRRERENPGPRFQVSSDAAEALGMLAGSPATLSVTALRREEPVEAEEAEAAIADAETVPADEAAPAVAEADTAADDAAMAGTPEAAAAEAERIAAAEAAAAEAAPKKRGLFGFLRKKPAEPEAPDAPALVEAPVAEGTEPAAAAEIAAATSAVLGEIETATLSGDGSATPVAAAPPTVEVPVAAPPLVVEEPVRKRRGLFGFGRRDEAPLSALSEDSASAAPVVVAPLDVSAAAPAPVGETLDPMAARVEVAAPVVAEPAPRRRGLFGFGRRDEAPLSALDPVEVSAPLPAAPEAAPAAETLTEVAPAADAVADVAAPEPRRRGLFGFGSRRAAEAEAAPVEGAAPVEVAALAAAAEAAPTLDPDADFVQAGRFRSLDEAEQAAEGLRSGGVLPSLRRGGDGDWLVLVGPFPDPADRTGILDKVKSLGYSDAYLVPG